MRLRASWHATPDANGVLRTIGVMVMSGAEIGYLGFPDLEPESSAMREELKAASAAGCTAASLFEYHTTEGSNGITVEWSEPFAVDGPSIDLVLARLIGERENIPRPL